MTLRYPYKKITESDDYLQIDVVEYKAPGLGTQEGSFALNTSDQTYADLGGTDSKAKILETIILPIPDNIKDSNSAEWGKGTLGPVEAAIGNLASSAIQDPKTILNQAKTKISDVLGALSTGETQKSVQLGATSLAVRAVLGGGAGQRYLERGAGITFNQNVELLFTGVNLRGAFEFDFDMLPRSEKESDEVKKIIRTFKKYSAVRKGLDTGGAAGLFLKAPQVFRIRYMSGGKPHPFLNKFKVCALLSMGVNYTGSGTYATYPDASPVHLQMSLQFQELTPIFYEDYLTREEQGKDDGTGVGY